MEQIQGEQIAVCRVYQMNYPNYDLYDTLCISRGVLPDLLHDYHLDEKTDSSIK